MPCISCPYMVAECRLDSLMSVVFSRSSTGETNPSTSSSMWSRMLSMLRSLSTVILNWVRVSPSSSEPSSSSCKDKSVGRWRDQMPAEGAWTHRGAALRAQTLQCEGVPTVLVCSSWESNSIRLAPFVSHGGCFLDKYLMISAPASKFSRNGLKFIIWKACRAELAALPNAEAETLRAGV